MSLAGPPRGGVTVTPVHGRADLREFVGLPFRLHAGTPWIPPLKLERYAYLSRRLNPFFKHGDAQLFLARRDGRVVGRISAQYDRNFNEYHGNRWGMFGFLEFEDDQQVPRKFSSTQPPAPAQGAEPRPDDRAVRPDHQRGVRGVLIEGYELEPMIRPAVAIPATTSSGSRQPAW